MNLLDAGTQLITHLGLDSISSQYSLAINYYQQALEIARQTSDHNNEAKVLGNLGILCRLQGNFQDAINYHQQQLKISLELGEHTVINNAIENLGVAHYYIGEYELALDFFQTSLRLNTERSDRKGMGINCLRKSGKCLYGDG